MNAALDTAKAPAKFQIGRRVIGGIAAQNEERFHLPGLHLSHQAAQGLNLVARTGFSHFGVSHRLADVAQRLIEPMRQRMDCGRLPFAGHDDARATMLSQVLRQRVQPLGGGFLQGGPRRCGRCPSAKFFRQAPGDLLDAATLQRQPMVGHGARDRRRAFHHVEAAHFPPAVADPAAIAELPGVAQALRMGVKEIRVQRHHHRRLVKSIVRLGKLAKCQPRPIADRVAGDGVELDPLGFWKAFEQAAQLRFQSRRGDGRGQETQTGSVILPVPAQQGVQIG